MFEISKIVGFVAQPLNFAILLLVLSFIPNALGRNQLTSVMVFLAFLVLAMSAWSSLGTNLIAPLEERFARPAPAPAKVDGIVVLGGAFEGTINLERGGYELNNSGDRFVEAAVLARRYPDAKLLISGGSSAFMLVGEADADTAQRFFAELGIDPSRLIIENKSRNTEENARFSLQVANPKLGETWLLVTSAFHMPRSVALFRQAGFPVVAWPVDYRTSGNERIGFFVDNTLDSLQKMTLATREWIGLVAYWWRGSIGSPFPAP
jgi:uncharacterized SAM-binding protein YcdF (DUF218 family)